MHAIKELQANYLQLTNYCIKVMFGINNGFHWTQRIERGKKPVAVAATVIIIIITATASGYDISSNKIATTVKMSTIKMTCGDRFVQYFYKCVPFYVF